MFLFGVLVPWIFIYPNEIQAVATVVGLVGIVIAYTKFLADQRRESTLSVVDQLGFFRNEILTRVDKLTETIVSNDLKKEWFLSQISSGGIDRFELSHIKEVYPRQIENQSLLMAKPGMGQAVTGLLNSMEEFSWSVILNNTLEHEALYATHDAFMHMVERYTYRLLSHKTAHPKQYEGIKRVYLTWTKLNKYPTQ